MPRGGPPRRRPGPLFLIGWDVGGWNCERNARSRDALVVLDRAGRLCGTPWRGNLRPVINGADGTRQWLEMLLGLCGVRMPRGARAVLAIDAPLGFPEPFLALAAERRPAGPVGTHAENPYLHRAAERWLMRHGLRPLSPLKDMIGSQATKAMHALARFAPVSTACGVWSDGVCLTAVETYPTGLRRSPGLRAEAAALAAGVLRGARGLPERRDHEDALLCALLARRFALRPEDLAAPPPGTPEREGWIWLPRDALAMRGG